MRTASDVLQLIGRTPLVQLNRLDTGPCRLFAKLESQNPGGSIKDRMAFYMIRAAEESGLIRPGDLLVEATAGNTGLGLALVASQKGYRLLLVIPDKMSREKVLHLRALGAEVLITRSDVGRGHPEYYLDMAQRIATERSGYYVNQFSNPANPQAHEETTAPEIWEQMEHRLDAVVCGVGSGGTLTGMGRFFRRIAPAVTMVLADPEGSVLAEVSRGGKPPEPGSWVVEGIGEDFVPPNCDLSLVGEAFTVTDLESLAATRELLFKEGILAGSSSGTLLAAALKYCRAQKTPKRVVTLVCDSGSKYLSKVFNDDWMIEQGFLSRGRQGDLRDLILRRQQDHAVVTVGPDENLLAALSRMNANGISQLPVMSEGKLVGIIDEYDILLTVRDDAGAFRRPVRSAMSGRLETIAPGSSMAELEAVLERGLTAVVVENGEFLGLITKIDLLNELRRRSLPAG